MISSLRKGAEDFGKRKIIGRSGACRFEEILYKSIVKKCRGEYLLKNCIYFPDETRQLSAMLSLKRFLASPRNSKLLTIARRRRLR